MECAILQKTLDTDGNGDSPPPLAVPLDDSASQSFSETHLTDKHSRKDESVGVIVVTGYLGAGKSTLVNHVLSSQCGKRIAVILNEIGEEVGVERAMINEGNSHVEEWVELSNGCVCCTVKHSLVQVLEQLVQMNRRLDHILLETTGLANPAPLASILWLDDQLESIIKLSSIVTVVDAKNLQDQLHDQSASSFSEVFLQIAFADLIILNKVDLMCSKNFEETVEWMETELKKINSLARIVRSVQCRVDVSEILNYEAYDAAHISRLEALLEDREMTSSTSFHTERIQTVCISETQNVDLIKVRSWLEEILWEKKGGMEVYRCKGILNVENSNDLHALQGVKEIYDIVPARAWRQGEHKTNKIVFIGFNLNKQLLSSFKECTAATGSSL